MSKKVFFILLSVVLGIIFLGTTPASKKVESSTFPTPEKGKWCLGYDYKNHKYRYHTEPTYTEKKVIVHRSSSSSFELYENGNFTKEQAKDIEEYLNTHKSSSTREYDIEDIIDNLEYYY